MLLQPSEAIGRKAECWSSADKWVGIPRGESSGVKRAIELPDLSWFLILCVVRRDGHPILFNTHKCSAQVTRYLHILIIFWVTLDWSPLECFVQNRLWYFDLSVGRQLNCLWDIHKPETKYFH